MPYRKKKRTRFRKKRKSFRRKRRVARANRTNTRVYNYKFSTLLSLIPDDETPNIVQAALYMNFLFWLTDGSTNNAYTVVPPAYVRCSDLYALYRVRGMAIRYIPRFNGGAPVKQVDTYANDNLAWAGFDIERPNVPQTAQEAANYPNMVLFNPCRGKKWYIPNRSSRGWFYTSADPNDLTNTLGTQTPTNPMGGFGFSILGPQNETDQPIGTMQVTFYVQFKGIDTTQIMPPGEFGEEHGSGDFGPDSEAFTGPFPPSEKANIPPDNVNIPPCADDSSWSEATGCGAKPSEE